MERRQTHSKIRHVAASRRKERPKKLACQKNAADPGTKQSATGLHPRTKKSARWAIIIANEKRLVKTCVPPSQKPITGCQICETNWIEGNHTGNSGKSTQKSQRHFRSKGQKEHCLFVGQRPVVSLEPMGGPEVSDSNRRSAKKGRKKRTRHKGRSVKLQLGVKGTYPKGEKEPIKTWLRVANLFPRKRNQLELKRVVERLSRGKNGQKKKKRATRGKFEQKDEAARREGIV